MEQEKDEEIKSLKQQIKQLEKEKKRLMNEKKNNNKKENNNNEFVLITIWKKRLNIIAKLLFYGSIYLSCFLLIFTYYFTSSYISIFFILSVLIVVTPKTRNIIQEKLHIKFSTISIIIISVVLIFISMCSLNLEQANEILKYFENIEE